MPFFFEVIAMGLILSADSFSAAVAMGSRKFSRLDLFKFAFASGGAEALSTLAGYLAGAKVISMISAYDHWIAFGLLAAVAAHMAYDGVRGLRDGTTEQDAQHFHGFAKVLIVSFATSMDAFGVGIGLGLANRPAWPFIVSIGTWAFVTTIAGMYIGSGVAKKMGPLFTLLAAAVLAYLSTEMLKI